MKTSLENAGYEVFGNSLTPSHETNMQKVDLCDLVSVRNLVEAVVPEVVVHLGACRTWLI